MRFDYGKEYQCPYCKEIYDNYEDAEMCRTDCHNVGRLDVILINPEKQDIEQTKIKED